MSEYLHLGLGRRGRLLPADGDDGWLAACLHDGHEVVVLGRQRRRGCQLNDVGVYGDDIDGLPGVRARGFSAVRYRWVWPRARAGTVAGWPAVL